MLMLPDERYCAVLMAAAGCQGVKLEEEPAKAILKMISGYDGVLLVTDDVKLKLHNFANGNDYGADVNVSALKLAEMAESLCEEAISSVAESGEADRSGTMREFRKDRRYIRRAIVACGMAR